MKIIKFLEGSGLLIKGICKAIKDETKEKIGGLFCMLLELHQVLVYLDSY